jgi:hypothetical protein
VLFLDSTRAFVLPMAGRSFYFKPLSSSGDYECGQIIGEYTLELRNEEAHGCIRDKVGIHLTQVPPTSCGFRQQSAGMAVKLS